jgi:hypothetical protein
MSIKVCIVGAPGKLGKYMVQHALDRGYEPVWRRHVGDPILESNLTRRTDFALFMVEALTNDSLIHEAPAIVGCQTPSALAYAAAARNRPNT